MDLLNQEKQPYIPKASHLNKLMVLGGIAPLGKIQGGSRILARPGVNFPNEMEWIFNVLKGIRLLGKVPLRQTSRRRASFLSVSPKGIYPSGGKLELADILGRKIVRRMETGELDELESICQRIGIGEKVTVQKFTLSKESGGVK